MRNRIYKAASGVRDIPFVSCAELDVYVESEAMEAVEGTVLDILACIHSVSFVSGSRAFRPASVSATSDVFHFSC